MFWGTTTTPWSTTAPRQARSSPSTSLAGSQSLRWGENWSQNELNIKFDWINIFSFLKQQIIFQISSVGTEDGGVYSCRPHNIIPDTVTINIMDSDGNFAAVYKDSVSKSPVISDVKMVVFLLLSGTTIIMN